MYRWLIAAVAAFTTIGGQLPPTEEKSPEITNQLEIQLPRPRSEAEQEVAQVRGAEELLAFMQNAIAEQDKAREETTALLGKIAASADKFEASVGKISSLNEKVEKVALVALRLDEADLDDRVAVLEKAIVDLKAELEKCRCKCEVTTGAAAPTTGAQPTATPAAAAAPPAKQQPVAGYGPVSGPVVGNGSTGGYASSNYSYNGYASSSGPVVGNGSTGGYASSSGYTGQLVGGGSTGGYASSPIVVSSSPVYCIDAYGNQVPCNTTTSPSGSPVYCVDAYGNQVPCNNSQVSTGSVGGPLQRWVEKRRSR